MRNPRNPRVGINKRKRKARGGNALKTHRRADEAQEAAGGEHRVAVPAADVGSRQVQFADGVTRSRQIAPPPPLPRCGGGGGGGFKDQDQCIRAKALGGR